MYGYNAILAFHILVVGPLLIYTGYTGQIIQGKLLKVSKKKWTIHLYFHY